MTSRNEKLRKQASLLAFQIEELVRVRELERFRKHEADARDLTRTNRLRDIRLWCSAHQNGF
jgi:hypothetical protein